jgi:hypothetical protein
LLYLFVALILFVFRADAAAAGHKSFAKFAAIAGLFTCSMWLKETAEAMFVFAVTGLALALITARRMPAVRSAGIVRKHAALLAAFAAGFAMCKAPYLFFQRPAGSTPAIYTSYAITSKLVGDNAFFYLTQQPDIILLGVFASMVTVLVWWRLRFSLPDDPKSLGNLIFIASLLATAWAYVVGLLIWRWPMSYYLLVPAIFFRIVTCYGLYVAWCGKLCSRRNWFRLAAVISCLFLYAVVCLYYTGAAQVAYSQIYTTALRAYAGLSQQNDSLVIESYPFYSEQVWNSMQLFNVAFHKDRKVTGIASNINPAVLTPEIKQLVHLTDEVIRDNERWPKEGDYVLTFTGNLLGTWEVRGIAPWFSDGSDLQRDGSYDMTIVEEKREYFPAAFLNIWTHRPNADALYSGFQLYRINKGPRFTWLGRYPDGWTTGRARLTMYPRYANHAEAHVSTSPNNPSNHVSVYRNDVLYAQADLSTGNEWSCPLSAAGDDKPTTFRFEVARTFVPMKIHLNRDKRELGVLVRLESVGRY